jgi:two-component system response regulator
MRWAEKDIILLAEENSDDIELIKRVFARNGIGNKLEVIQDGEEVLDYLFHRGIYQGRTYSLPSLILLCIRLPKLEALEVAREIKADTKTSAIPLVLLISMEEERELIEEAGLKVDGVIQKPIDIDKLKKVAEGVVFSLVFEEGKKDSL